MTVGGDLLSGDGRQIAYIEKPIWRKKEMFEGKWQRCGIGATPCLTLLAILLSIPLMADSQPDLINGVYVGTIGNQNVVLEMGVAADRTT
jgi:hypothetical protein